MASRDEFIYQWEYNGRTITFSWVGNVDVVPSRVYALAFSAEGRMLLVGGGPDDPDFWLPGGGIEEGETPEEALIRELSEEAAATVQRMKIIGAQRVDDSDGACEYHAFFWCRVTLADEFIPQYEVVERRLVDPKYFLDTLFWGRSDPKAEMLFETALKLEHGA
ncbi:MAG: NUDIX hydrolase [Limnochordia bacterium]